MIRGDKIWIMAIVAMASSTYLVQALNSEDTMLCYNQFLCLPNDYDSNQAGFNFGHFFWSLVHASTIMSHAITDIHGFSQIF